jgi:Flp pilus assembly protein TadG
MKFFRGRPSTGRHRSRGQAIVELALVFPIFMMLLAGMIAFGIGLYDYMVIISAARDGARVGTTTCSSTTTPCAAAIWTRVDTASGGLHPTITVGCATAGSASFSQATCNSGAAKEGGSIKVTVSYTYRMFGTQIPMTAESKFMIP